MKKILISLDYVPYTNFVSGNKKNEYRKRWPKEPVIAYIYVKAPIQKIMVKLTFDKPVIDDVETIANIAKSEHLDWYENIKNYLSNKTIGVAAPLSKVEKLKSNITLKDMRLAGIHPPSKL